MYRCVFNVASSSSSSSSSSWAQASAYSSAQSLGGGLQQIACDMGALEGQGEGTMTVRLQ